VETPAPQRCGFVAIVGRPNVGKSTLLNRLVGQKVSVTAPKPQTTRYRILGVKTTGATQAVYVDTPGLHRRAGRAINRLMNRVAESALADVDVVLFVVEALRWESDDDLVLERVGGLEAPVILVLNKVDLAKDKAALLPYIAGVATRMGFAEVVPISARGGAGLTVLEGEVERRLPAAPWLFPADQVTDRPMRFLAAEIVREKLMRRLGEEVPYRLSVEVEEFSEAGPTVRIRTTVWVEKPGQKAIVIGEGGRTLKAIGSLARRELERMLGRPVYLGVWVKVKAGWSDDERLLRRMGLGD
jgi:GTP-binding protein Era